MRRGSELKKASRREPSVWMHSLISKKEGMKGEESVDKERASFLFFLASEHTQIYQPIYRYISAVLVIYIMCKCDAFVVLG